MQAALNPKTSSERYLDRVIRLPAVNQSIGKEEAANRLHAFIERISDRLLGEVGSLPKNRNGAKKMAGSFFGSCID